MHQILIIEDDIALRENTAELLELSGYTVFTAPNGKIGVQKALEILPNIIVCDIMMPEMDGYGVLETLNNNPKTSNIPFIFLSAKTEHKEVRKGMDLGADDYLTKPFEEDELISAIESRIAKATLLKKNNNNNANDTNQLKNLNELKNFFDDQGKIIKINKGETLYEEGMPSNYIYLIIKGVIKTHKIDEAGKELITALYKPDDFLGFTSFEEQVPYQEGATAIENVELAAISKTSLKEILTQSKEVTLELVNVLTENLAAIKAQLLQMAYSSVRKKTAQTILQFVTILNKKPTEQVKIARYDLANVAGIATESLIRTLSAFKKEGIIDIEGRNIKILNINALQNME